MNYFFLLLHIKILKYNFFFIKFMLDIIMNFDISVRLTYQISTIICYDVKCIIKRKKKIYKTMKGLGHTNDKKR